MYGKERPMIEGTRMRVTLALAALWLTVACGGDAGQTGGGEGGAGSELSGTIEADGSSTVFPITAAMAEEFGIETRGGVNVNVGQSGTGGGFKRFCAGETDISDASRPISDSEREQCIAAGVEFLEIPVAIDGLAVVANPANEFVQCLTVEELKTIWAPGSRVQRWSQVRPAFPDEPIALYGPGTNSGTFDYFTEVIGGETGASRADYQASEDDNVLVTGVEGDRNALGYFGYAYYVENEQRLKVVGVDAGDGCVTPTPETVKSGQYHPLSRPLFIYVKRSALQRPAVREFVRFYLENAAQLVTEVGYVPMEDAEYQASLRDLEPGQGAS
jgi:phosphate transport system substrate-binding protein